MLSGSSVRALLFPPQEKVIFGSGAVKHLSDEIKRLEGKRAFVITGNTIAKKTDLLSRVEEAIGSRLAGVFFPIPQHVPRRDVIAAAHKAREAKADTLISLGGSSTVDGAKAVALALSEGVVSEEALDAFHLRGARGTAIRSRALPHIAITTTLSAGEFTSGFGITDTERQKKEIFGAPQFIPRAVILDPELTSSTPLWLWASTGMRAVDHAVERLYSPRHQPLVDTLCIRALRYFFQNLLLSVREPDNMEARLNCQIGAWMSAIGFSSVGIGISHAIGHQLGGRCNVPHGQTSCIVLPHAMEFNLPAAADRLGLVAEAAGLDTRKMSPRQSAVAAIDAVRRLVRDLGCPARLRDVGVRESDFPTLAKAVMDEASLMQNPRPVEEIADVIGILEKAW